MEQPNFTAAKWFHLQAWIMFLGMIIHGFYGDTPHYFSGMVAMLTSVAVMLWYQMRAPDAGAFSITVLFWSGISSLPVIFAVM